MASPNAMSRTKPSVAPYEDEPTSGNGQKDWSSVPPEIAAKYNTAPKA